MFIFFAFILDLIS